MSNPLSHGRSLRTFVGIRAVFDREAWNWKPSRDADADNPDGFTTELEDYTKLDAGITLSVEDNYEVFLKVNNILGEDIENLDDIYTVLDGEPVIQVGFSYNFPISSM
jgi:hypothetical protein